MKKPSAALSLFVLLTLCVLSLLCVFLWVTHQRALRTAETVTRNLAEIISSRISDDFARIDAILSLVAADVSPADLALPAAADLPELPAQLARQVEHFDLLSGLYVFDAQGLLRQTNTAMTQFSVGDRAHFLQLKHSPVMRSFSSAQVARADGRWSIAQLRAIRGPSGEFLGAVSATVDIKSLARRLGGVTLQRPAQIAGNPDVILPDQVAQGSRIDLGAGGLILLRRTDDFKLIQRVPPLNIKDFNQALPESNPVRQRIVGGERQGSLRLIASTDGVHRLASFQRLEKYPFYVQVALAEEDFLKIWRREAMLATLLVCLLLGGVAAALYYMARAENRRLALHAQLQERNLALEQANSELEHFSCGISHDMRHPLRMIASYLQLIEMNLVKQLDEENQAYFHFATDGAKRLDKMLIDLLDYSRIGKGGEITAFSSRMALTEALLYLLPEKNEAAANISITGDWPPLQTRRDDVVRLLQNLVGNALKFRQPGQTPNIHIHGVLLEGFWRCCIHDGGIGIAPGQAERLFRIFARLHSADSYAGTGVGLAVCRKIVEQNKGRIWAESAGENQGSTFCFEFPVAHQPPAPELDEAANLKAEVP